MLPCRRFSFATLLRLSASTLLYLLPVLAKPACRPLPLPLSLPATAAAAAAAADAEADAEADADADADAACLPRPCSWSTWGGWTGS